MLKSIQTYAFASIVAAGLLAAGAAGAQEASTAAAGANPGALTSIKFSAQQTQAAERALTSLVLRQAKPMPMPQLSEDEFRKLFPHGGAPAPKAADQPVQPEAAGNINSIPLRFAGKLILQLSPTSAALCTAQFISPTVILTAAHCVTSGGRFLRSLTFRHQYQNGTFNPRSYPIVCVGGWTNWLQNTADKYRWDYAMIKVATPSANGNMGAQYNWIGAYANWTAIGYPVAISNGQIIQQVAGRRGTVSSGVVETIHGVAGFTQGASGGAWIARYSANPAGNNFAISVNSFIRTNLPGRVYGPYFDANLVTLFNYVNRGCK